MCRLVLGLTRLFLPRLGQVGDAGVGAHEDVAGVQPPLQVQLLDLRQVDAPQRGLGEGVGRDQGQAEHAHPVDAVDGLRGRTVRVMEEEMIQTRGLKFGLSPNLI